MRPHTVAIFLKQFQSPASEEEVGRDIPSVDALDDGTLERVSKLEADVAEFQVGGLFVCHDPNHDVVDLKP